LIFTDSVFFQGQMNANHKERLKIVKVSKWGRLLILFEKHMMCMETDRSSGAQKIMIVFLQTGYSSGAR